MGWPQITMIVLLTLGVGLNLQKHGEKRTDKYNFWASLFGTAINVWLLIAGGFF